MALLSGCLTCCRQFEVKTELIIIRPFGAKADFDRGKRVNLRGIPKQVT
jgi:hypothetical protein